MENNNINHHDKTKEKIWTSLEKRIDTEYWAAYRKSAVRRKWLMAASVVIFLSLGSVLGYHSFIKPDIYLSTNKSQKVQLADGSVITLLPGAELTVEKSFPSDTRDVFLKGDAIFSVAKSKEHPFIVHTEGFQTKVLGTVFKIMQSTGEYKVELYEGKVMVNKYVRNKDQTEKLLSETILKPKETFKDLKGKGISMVVTSEKEAGTKEKILHFNFDDTNLRDISKVLAEIGIQLKYPEQYATHKVTGTLDGDNAQSIIESIAFLINLEAAKTKNGYELK